MDLNGNSQSGWEVGSTCNIVLKGNILFCFRHIKGRVMVALADGSVAVFHRATGRYKCSIQTDWPPWTIYHSIRIVIVCMYIYYEC